MIYFPVMSTEKRFLNMIVLSSLKAREGKNPIELTGKISNSNISSALIVSTYKI